MTPARPGSRFWPWGEPRPAPAEPDPADLGTAFGLDLSIGEFDDPSAPDTQHGATGERPAPQR